jgi:hypothetical protein
MKKPQRLRTEPRPDGDGKNTGLLPRRLKSKVRKKVVDPRMAQAVRNLMVALRDDDEAVWIPVVARLRRIGLPEVLRLVNCFSRSGTNGPQSEATFAPSGNGNVRCCNSRFLSLR